VPVAETRVVAMVSSPSPPPRGARGPFNSALAAPHNGRRESTRARREGRGSRVRCLLHTVGAMAGGPPGTHPVEDLASLDRAIAGLEGQRSLLGDDVVETALAPLRERRAALLLRQAGEQRKLVTVLFADVVHFTVL